MANVIRLAVLQDARYQYSYQSRCAYTQQVQTPDGPSVAPLYLRTYDYYDKANK